uniref:Uncharacterized protein n=1 Tax=Siphoviridae sp. ctqPo10 TaxID=2827948 RepID=A0A8S5SUP5_9CAUD|nr:MAG TPA: hypothetical protein [Siphoviridae sp. ctqPo10]
MTLIHFYSSIFLNLCNKISHLYHNRDDLLCSCL